MTNIKEIPIQYYNRINEHIKIQCEVSSVDRKYARSFNLILDTGATISGISEDVALQLGYDPSKPLRCTDIDTAGGIERDTPIIKVSMINIDGMKIECCEILCSEKFDGIYTHGVIGLDFLTQYNLCINFDKNSMRIYQRKEIIITP